MRGKLLLLTIGLAAMTACSENRSSNKEVNLADSVKTDIKDAVDQIDSLAAERPISVEFNGSDGKTRRAYLIKVIFYPGQEHATLSDDENTYQLTQYVTGSGYGYKGKGVDLRGKGKNATLTYPDGLVLELSEKSSRTLK